MANAYDAVVIGGGHNGLVAAAYLGRAGMRVLVLERRHVLGGAAVTEEVFPGFRFSVASYVVSLLRPEIIRELDLTRYGLEILPLDGTFAPLDDDRYLWMTSDHGRTMRNLRWFSKRDAEAYEEFGQVMSDMVRFIKPIMSVVPPDPMRLDPRQWLPLRPLWRSFRALPPDERVAFVQLMTMSAVDFVSQWFETDPLIGTMSSWGIIGTFLGIRSPGTAYVMLHHYMGEVDGAFGAWGVQRGGTGAVSEAIASAARAHGVEIRTEAEVDRVLTRGDRAMGVVLRSGEEIRARHVLSNADARRTFLGLVEPGSLPDDFLDEVRRFKYRGSSGKVNLALDGLPEFTALPNTETTEHLRGSIGIGSTIDYLERAYDDAKYGRFSREPFIDLEILSIVDPSMAPPGKHVASCFVQYAPYDLDGGWDDASRDAFGDAVVDAIARYAPNIKDLILHRQVLTPKDIEDVIGLSEGNIFQGELTLQQMFFLRPVPAWAKYRTPLAGLYQCGAGTHPGGGVMGASGRNAALQILGRA
jgi:phytoene dehydrogenase-like protein